MREFIRKEDAAAADDVCVVVVDLDLDDTSNNCQSLIEVEFVDDGVCSS